MKLLKRMAVCLLAAAMALSMLTACDDGGDAPAASSNPPASSGSTDTGTKDPDPPASTEPTKPTLPTTWAETRTNAYFTRLGVSAENVYEEYEGVVEGGVSAAVKCAAKDGKLYWEGTALESTTNRQHIADYIDEKGNAYDIDFGAREIRSYDAGTEGAEGIQLRIEEMLALYIPIPKAADVAKVSATENYQYDNQNYYAESIKIRVKLYDQIYTDEWDYLFDGDELKYVILPGTLSGTTVKVQKIEANPADSVFALPSWYSKNFESSKTSAYFRSKGVSKDRYAVQFTVEPSYGGESQRVMATANGSSAFLGNSYWWNTDGTLNEGNLILGDYNNYYYIDYSSERCYGPQTIETMRGDSIRAAGGYLLIPDASNTLYMTSGPCVVETTTYEKESFYIAKGSETYRYDYYFRGGELAFLKVNNSTVTFEKISGTPVQDYLQVPDGFEVVKPNEQ